MNDMKKEKKNKKKNKRGRGADGGRGMFLYIEGGWAGGPYKIKICFLVLIFNHILNAK